MTPAPQGPQRAAPSRPDEFAVAVYFRVSVDRIDGSFDLGTFISCEGLAMDMQTEDRPEGGNNGFVWKLPVRISYSNVRLTRPIGPDTAKVVKWFTAMSAGGKRTTANITALSPDSKPIVSWTLADVLPVKWSGPSFTAESAKVATETLELAHHGIDCKAS